MNTITFACPKCHQVFEVGPEKAGKRSACLRCGSPFLIPSLQAAPPAAPRPIPIPPPPAPSPQAADPPLDDVEIVDEVEVVAQVEVLPARSPRRQRDEYDDDGTGGDTRGWREEDDERDYRPRRPRPRKKKGVTRLQFSRTNLGLGFHYAKLLCYLIAACVTILGFLGIVLIGAGGALSEPQHGAEVAGAGRLVSILVFFSIVGAQVLAPLLGITGSILCCWVPPKTEARPLIVISLALDCAPIVLFMMLILVAGMSRLLNLGPGTGVFVTMLLVLSMLLSPAAFVLFILFVRRLAFYFGEDGLGNEAMDIIINLAVLIGCTVVGVFLVALLLWIPLLGPLLGLGGMMAFIIYDVKLLIRILNLIASVRQVLRTCTGA